jgi:hypothetical protein
VNTPQLAAGCSLSFGKGHPLNCNPRSNGLTKLAFIEAEYLILFLVGSSMNLLVPRIAD